MKNELRKVKKIFSKARFSGLKIKILICKRINLLVEFCERFYNKKPEMFMSLSLHFFCVLKHNSIIIKKVNTMHNFLTSNGEDQQKTSMKDDFMNNLILCYWFSIELVCKNTEMTNKFQRNFFNFSFQWKFISSLFACNFFT